jgi:hypothetical protein
MGVYDQIKKAFQDVVAPEIRALQGEIRALLERELKIAVEVRERLAVLEAKLTSR